MPMKGKLFLIPNTLGDSPIGNVIPAFNSEIINSIQFYIVEDVRTARRFLAKCKIKTKIDELQFFILNQHTKPQEFSQFLKPIHDGNHIGIISEAGCPAVADPGSEIVKMAHDNDIEVVPLVGPSSIILALMASGFNGQSFSFNGYLPIKQDERVAKLKKDEIRSRNENQTQIYIETPYRNSHLFDSLIEALNHGIKLCIAADISLETEFIKTKLIKQWKLQKPDLNKRPAIFLFHAK
jgi:16S rRNA (cytidine1402-2'-O)-methyltransferase